MTLGSQARPYSNVAVEAVVGEASVQVAAVWAQVQDLAGADLPEMGLAAGLRPVADVQVLIGLVAAAESELARRLEGAARAGCLPLAGVGALPAAAGWARRTAALIARCGSFAARWPQVGAVWAAGVITADHVDVLARCDRLSDEQLAEILEQLEPLWPALTPAGLARFVDRVVALLHPPPDPVLDERDTYDARSLTWAVTGDAVVLSGLLPRAEGEIVIAALDAFAERLRDRADYTPAPARRADALVALVNAAHASGTLPSRGGLPVALTVTLDQTAAGDLVATTSRGHLLTDSEVRFAQCDAAVTPVLVETGCGAGGDAPLPRGGGPQPASPTTTPSTPQTGTPIRSTTPGAPQTVSEPGLPDPKPTVADDVQRIRALAAVLLGARQPLAVGRTARTATPAQRRALAVRDRGCVIPGCGIPAEACQVHHLIEWAAGGPTDIGNLVLLCWAHHRQVELGMWTLRPRRPADHLPFPEPRSPADDAPGASGATPGPRAAHRARPAGQGPSWEGNNGSPWMVTTRPRHRWRL